jgi:hypothetical protein
MPLTKRKTKMGKLNINLFVGIGLSFAIGLLSTNLTADEDKYLLEPESIPTKAELQYESDIQAIQAYLGADSAIGRISREEAEARLLNDPGVISLANEAINTKATVKAPASTVIELNVKDPNWDAGVRTYQTNGDIFGLLALDAPNVSQAYGAGGFLWNDYGYITQAGVWGSTAAPNSMGVLAENTTSQGTQGVALHARAVHASLSEDDPFNHAVVLENSANDWPAVLALYMSGENQSAINDFDNFITFIARNDAFSSDVAIGSIDGNGSGGVRFNTSGADIAEYLERADHSESIESGDIVGVVGGKITKELSQAHNIHVISSGAAVTGNAPGQAREDTTNYEQVAFIGQAPVKVTGAVATGDFIIASGKHDGTGIAVSPRDMTPENYRLMVGRAWESADDTGLKLINTAVGLGPNDTYAFMAEQQQIISDQNLRITALENRLSDKLAQLEHLSTTLESLTQKVAYIHSLQMTASK